MISVIIWCVFGLIAGFLAKVLHPGEDPIGLIPTILIGVCGSFIGGAINWVVEAGRAPFEPSGLIMSVVGGVLFCAVWRFYNLKMSKDGPRSFISGKKING